MMKTNVTLNQVNQVNPSTTFWTSIKVILFTFILSLFLSPLVVHAAGSLDDYPIDQITSWLDSNFRTLTKDVDYSEDQGLVGFRNIHITLNGESLYITASGENKILKGLTSAEQNQQQNEEVSNVIQGVNNNLSLKPDTQTAMTGLSGFLPAINLILGLIVTVITAGMTLLTACDVFFISFPPFRGLCEDMKAEGKNVSTSRSEKSGETKLKFISDEAEYAIRSAETAQTGKSPLIVYLQKRSVAIIMTTVVLFILITGNLDVVTNIALKAVSGILNIIQSIG